MESFRARRDVATHFKREFPKVSYALPRDASEGTPDCERNSCSRLRVPGVSGEFCQLEGVHPSNEDESTELCFLDRCLSKPV